MANTDIDQIWAGSHDLPKWFTRALDVPREEGHFDIDGVQIHYFRWGKRGNPPLLITHGFLAHARCFAFIAPFLADRYDIVAFDLAGMGESSIAAGTNTATRGAQMIGVAEAAGLFDAAEKPIIVAHSFGGSVGLNAMEQQGDRFGGLLMCDTMLMRPEVLIARWKKEGEGRPGNGNARRPNKIYPDYETARSRYILSPPQDVAEPFLMDYMAYHSLVKVEGGWQWKFDPQVFIRDESDQKSWLNAGQRIAELPHRKAIIYGEQSALFNNDSIAYLRELGANNIPIIAVPEAKHHLMLDQPLALVAALRSVLEFWR